MRIDDGAEASTLGHRPAQHRGASKSSRNAGRAHHRLHAGPRRRLFEHDGQITKREIRALTLSALAPRRGELSVGCRRRLRLGRHRVDAGAIRRLRAIAIEADGPTAPRASAATPPPSACPDLHVIEGRAPDALAGLAAPDAIFIGGGGERARRARRVHRRAAARRAAGRQRGDARDRSASAGAACERSAASSSASPCRGPTASAAKTGWRPAMPVTQWIWAKP